MNIKKLLVTVGRFVGLVDEESTRPPAEPLSSNLLEAQTVKFNSCESAEMQLVGLKAGETLRQKRDFLKNAGKRLAKFDEVRHWFQSN
jgi:hypothetical protein